MAEGWDWELTNRAKGDFESLDDSEQSRIARKLDDIVQDEWRESADYLDPLEGSPHRKLRVGPFRLGCRIESSSGTLYVLRIQKRGADAYRGDD